MNEERSIVPVAGRFQEAIANGAVGVLCECGHPVLRRDPSGRYWTKDASRRANRAWRRHHRQRHGEAS